MNSIIIYRDTEEYKYWIDRNLEDENCLQFIKIDL